MIQNEECQEILMQDVNRIDIMPVTALKINVPFNVHNIASAVVTMDNDDPLTNSALHSNSLLSLGLIKDDTTDVEMEEGLSCSSKEKIELAGNTWTHTLQLFIEAGFQIIRERLNSLKSSDFHVVMTTCEGTRYLLYSLPNTSNFSVDDKMGQMAQMKVNIVVQSMSGIVLVQHS